MKALLDVCLIAMAFIAGTSPQSVAQAQELRQGVSVQMAKTANATPMPEADNEDAWIVTITADGRIFFGVKPVTAENLIEEMKSTPRNRQASLYVKADARTGYGNVVKVLQAAKTDLFRSVVLLTNQNETSALGKLVAPKGLEVLLTSAASDAVLVQLHNSGRPRPAVKVGNQEIALSDLQTALNQSLQGKNERTVQVQADDSLPFGEIAQVIDTCSSVKATVVLPAE